MPGKGPNCPGTSGFARPGARRRVVRHAVFGQELGLAEESNGLLLLLADAPVGSALRDYLQLDDQLLTLKLTPNRADCLSLKGLAREVAALTGAEYRPVSIAALAPVVTTNSMSPLTRRTLVRAIAAA